MPLVGDLVRWNTIGLMPGMIVGGVLTVATANLVINPEFKDQRPDP